MGSSGGKHDGVRRVANSANGFRHNNDLCWPFDSGVHDGLGSNLTVETPPIPAEQEGRRVLFMCTSILQCRTENAAVPTALTTFGSPAGSAETFDKSWQAIILLNLWCSSKAQHNCACPRFVLDRHDCALCGTIWIKSRVTQSTRLQNRHVGLSIAFDCPTIIPLTIIPDSPTSHSLHPRRGLPQFTLHGRHVFTYLRVLLAASLRAAFPHMELRGRASSHHQHASRAARDYRCEGKEN